MSNPAEVHRALQVLAKAAKEGGTTIPAALVDQVSMTLGAAAPHAEQAGIMERIWNSAKYVVSGVTPLTWFGPWQPIHPMADAPEQGAVGRQFDFPVGFNTRIIPRQDEAISFPMLRAFGDNYDLLRLAIETCKDQIEVFEWEIIPEDPKADPKALHGEIKRISDFLEYPDKEHNWSQWFRMLLEDMLVIDAVAIFPTQTRGGSLYALDLVDGATIKRVLDQHGRTPVPPSPAYQQVLHGIPAVDYSRDELIYMVRNPRTNRIYGYSPIEQVLMTVNIAMRRQIMQLNEYTEGTIPDALISLPDSWTSQQIRDFQDWFDTILSGNTAVRRKARFIPETKGITFPKTSPLKDEYDEWLARIICWALSISPTALVKQQNRATSEQIADTAKEEGQLPRLRWLASQMNFLLKRTLGMQGVKFMWKVAKSVQPLEQAQVNQIYLATGVLTPDEVREELGREALPEEEIAPPLSTPQAVASQPSKEATEEPQEASNESETATGVSAEKITKAEPRRTSVGMFVAKNQTKLARRLVKAMRKHARKVAGAVAKAYAKKTGVTKADESEEDIVEAIIEMLKAEGLSDDIIEELTPGIMEAFNTGGILGVGQVGMDTSVEITRHLDKAALDYAKTRGAELVKGITETTERSLRSIISDAVEKGMSPLELSDAVEDAAAFNEARAMTIARTELAFAHVQGNVAGWKESGEVVGKRSILGDLHDVDDVCDECADAGVVAMDEDFVPGFDFPPYHPNCICDIVPVLSEED